MATILRHDDECALMEGYVADCLDCDWESVMPNQDIAAHAKRVHEDKTGHSVTIEV